MRWDWGDSRVSNLGLYVKYTRRDWGMEGDPGGVIYAEVVNKPAPPIVVEGRRRLAVWVRCFRNNGQGTESADCLQALSVVESKLERPLH